MSEKYLPYTDEERDIHRQRADALDDVGPSARAMRIHRWEATLDAVQDELGKAREEWDLLRRGTDGLIDAAALTVTERDAYKRVVNAWAPGGTVRGTVEMCQMCWDERGASEMPEMFEALDALAKMEGWGDAPGETEG